MKNPYEQKNSLGLGLAALGRPGYINLGHSSDLAEGIDVETMEKHSHKMMDQAWQLGIRYFDVARSYGLAEKFLSSWLELNSIPSESIKIGSKWGYTYTANWQVKATKHEVKEHTLEVLKRQILESRELLGDYLKLYHIHSATFESGVLENREVLNQLAHMKESGMLIGLSLSGSNQSDVLRKAMHVEVDGVRLFNGVQATYNILETSISEALIEAKSAGLSVIIKEALANGRLTPRNTDTRFNAGTRLIELALGVDSTMDALALAFVLQQSFVDIVLSGASTEKQLISNSCARSLQLNDTVMMELASLNQEPNVYWKERSEMEWN